MLLRNVRLFAHGLVFEMATIRKSNFDLTGAKLVKRGVLVSWHGLRFQVLKVRLGVCYPRSHVGRYHDMPKFFDCNAVQVVAS